VILDCRVLAGQTPLIYGSEGWGFESLRARPAHRPLARPAGGFLVVLGATLGATRASQPPNRARLIDSAAARPSPSSRCPYTSLVIAILACPSTSETTCSGVLWASILKRPSDVARADASDRARPARTAGRRSARSCPGPSAPHLAREDQTVILPQRPGRHLGLSLPSPMLPKPRRQLGSQHQRPPRLGCLQLADHQPSPASRRDITILDPLHAMSHPQRPSLPIQHRPVQAEHLTAAHPVGQSQHRRLEPVPGSGV